MLADKRFLTNEEQALSCPGASYSVESITFMYPKGPCNFMVFLWRPFGRSYVPIMGSIYVLQGYLHLFGVLWAPKFVLVIHILGALGLGDVPRASDSGIINRNEC